MSDPHPPDRFGATCPTPPSALPGDQWRCPDCGRAYFAQDGDDFGDGEGTFRWIIDAMETQPTSIKPRGRWTTNEEQSDAVQED